MRAQDKWAPNRAVYKTQIWRTRPHFHITTVRIRIEIEPARKTRLWRQIESRLREKSAGC